MSLPIEEILDNFKEQIQKRNKIVVEAPPGAGKTTLVPLSLLDLIPNGKQIFLVEPRRIAAKNAAIRMSKIIGESVGQRVGYIVRFEKQVSRKTKIIVMTDGILLQIIQNQPDLGQVYTIILDEFHERSVYLDMCLGFGLEIQKLFNPELKIVIMSATLNSEFISSKLDNCAIVKSQGKIYPLRIQHVSVQEERLPDKIKRVLGSVKEDGDILVFLPGKFEIIKTKEILNESFPEKYNIVPLYGDMSLEEQTQALFPIKNGKRRIVLATNIAESSLTIEGVSIVIDSGLVKEMKFHPGTSMSRLEVTEIAMDSADQRAGRAARMGPGVCYRLWDNNLSNYREKFTKPEILRADLSSLVLSCYMLGVEPENLTWITNPPEEQIDSSRRVLRKLGILDSNHILTEKGKVVAEFPFHPRIGNMIYEARKMGLYRLSYQMASVISEKDFLKRNKEYGSDLLFRVQALEKKTLPVGGDESGFRKTQKIYNEFLRTFPPPSTEIYDTGFLGLLLSYVYPERIGKIREKNSLKYKLANGKTAILDKADPIQGNDFLVLAENDGSQREALIFLSASIKEEEILKFWDFAFHTVVRVNLDGDKIHAIKETFLGEILISSNEIKNLTKEERINALVEHILEQGLHLFNWTEETIVFVQRIQFLRENGFDFPDFSERALLEEIEWLLPSLERITRISELKNINLFDLLKNRCTYALLQVLEKEAPTHYKVPSGSRIKIDYSGTSPILQVKLQEVFGLMQTPRLAGGKVPLLLELLSPAKRPVQKTQDLNSFWTRTYPEVRKELKGRYPKHPWPENPLEAEPTKHTRKRHEEKNK